MWLLKTTGGLYFKDSEKGIDYVADKADAVQFQTIEAAARVAETWCSELRYTYPVNLGDEQ